MYRYSTAQLAVITAVPTVTVLLLWTLAIFYKNKKQWRPYDICIVAILFQSIARNLSTLVYIILNILSQTNDIPTEYCTVSIWLLYSLHTFQASTLSTLSVIGFYLVKLTRKQTDIKQYLTSTHIVYHLFCLITLCACVGVAAILATRHLTPKSANFEYSFGRNISYSLNHFENCQFMPYHLDMKFNIFILSLHSLLALVSIVCFIGILWTFYQYKRNSFDYMNKSTSDLSELSLGAAASTVHNRKEEKTMYESEKHEVWTSDTSNISTSVSSTNSRRPCLMKEKKKKKKKKKEQNSGLETIMPVLIVSYLFHHLPVVVVCVFPWLPSPWTSGAGAALWLGLLQDALVPSALGLVDGRFNCWVSRAYRCGRSRSKSQQDKPPLGLDGKFRPFSSTTQTLEATPMVPAAQLQIRTRPNIPVTHQIIPQTDHKFPITNGSLYTSIDGRLPIIHNYRRHKGLRSPIHSISMGLHSTYVKRQESLLNHNIQPPNHFPPIDQCDDSFISLPADYTSIGSSYTTLKPSVTDINKHQTHICSQTNENYTNVNDVSIIEHELRKMSKSQNNLNEINVIQRDIQKFKHNPEMYQTQNLHLPNAKNEKEIIESSDDEYFNTYNDDSKNYDSISSQSCCSITTEANCDFEFFGQQNDTKPTLHSYQLKNDNIHDSYILKLNPKRDQNKNYPIMRSFKPFMCKNFDTVNSEKVSKNFRIRRSNSKQSLENLDTYISANQLERSNSNRSCDLVKNTFDKSTYIIRSYDVMRSNPNLSETSNLVKQKPSIARVNLKNLNSSCVHFGNKNDAYSRNLTRDNVSVEKQRVSVPVLSMESLNSMLNHKGISYLDNGDICNHNLGGSVPDFKKVFVTDFI